MNDVMKHVSNPEAGVTFSESAKVHLLSCLDKEGNCEGVRLSLKKTGCSGLSYVVDYVHKPEITDISLAFEGCYKVFIDKSSYLFLKGLHIDYVREGFNQKLVFQNPNQTGQCGCGESFTVDV